MPTTLSRYQNDSAKIRGDDAADVFGGDRCERRAALGEAEDVVAVRLAPRREMIEEVLVVERDVHVRGGQIRAACVLFDAALRIEVRHGEAAAGEQLGVRQRADDCVLDVARRERVDEIAAVLELALEVLPVVGHAERTVAAAQRRAQCRPDCSDRLRRPPRRDGRSPAPLASWDVASDSARGTSRRAADAVPPSRPGRRSLRPRGCAGK